MILAHQFEAMKHNIPDPDLVIYPHTEVGELKARIEKRLLKEGKVREGERGLLAESDTYIEDLNMLYEEFYPRYQGNKLRIESNDWKLVNDDGSIRYHSEEADQLLSIIKQALERNH